MCVTYTEDIYNYIIEIIYNYIIELAKIICNYTNKKLYNYIKIIKIICMII